MASCRHNALAKMGLVWFGARCGSFRGAPEISVGAGYVADAACVGVLFHSEFRRRCEAWGMAPKVIRYTYDTQAGEMDPHESGDIPDYFACVFEAKATRADFLSTFGGRANGHANRMKPAANLHWVVADKGVCTADEVPEFWGLLERRGAGLSEKKPARYSAMPAIDILRLERQLLWKRPGGETFKVRIEKCPECLGQLDDLYRGWASVPYPFQRDEVERCTEAGDKPCPPAMPIARGQLA